MTPQITLPPPQPRGLLFRRAPGIALAVSIVLVALVGVADWFTGPELSVAVFYIAAVAVASWWGGRRQGLGISLLSAVVWTACDQLSRTYDQPAVGWWNATVRLVTWAVIALLLAEVRLSAERERDRRGSGGGLRAPAGPEPFYTAVEMAFAGLRSGGAPFTLVYVETAGLHRSDDGDGESEVRERVMQALRGTMRRSDRIAAPRAREVALLLSDTGADVAGVALGRMAGVLREMIQTSGRLDAGALVGAVTCVQPVGDVNGVLQRAFQQMYFAPRLPGQVSISHDTFPGGQPAEPALAEPAAT